jgi:hypothetical protein
MKQTAVEWLVEQIIKEKGLIDLDIQAAKEMEKEQMLKTFAESRVISVECAVWNCEGDRKKWESFEQYYNETFKTNEK